MRKRIGCLILAALMMCGALALAACGGDSDEDMNSFTVFVPHALPSGYTSYNQLPVYQKLEEETGVKVTYVHGEYADILEMWNGGYYDVMMLSDAMTGGGYPGGLEKGVEDGVLWDLTDTINESAPNYLATVAGSYDSVKKFTKTDNGKRIGMYNIPLEEQGPWYGFVVREDWLRIYQEKTGAIAKDAALLPLVTYADWENYLLFVKTYINKGKAPLFLYYTGTDMVGTLNAGFDVSSELYLKNGTTVTYGAMEAEYEEYLKQMKKWYSLGLIDANFAANNEGTESQMPQAAAMDNYSPENGYTPAQYAAFPMIYTYLSTYEKIMSQLAPVYQAAKLPQYSLLPVAAPKQSAEDELHIRYTEKSSSYIAITNKVKSKEKVEKIVKWFDNLFSEEGMMLMNYGTEGDTYTMVDGQPKFTEKITKNPDNLSFADSISTYVTLNFIYGYDWKRELQVVTAKERSAMEEIWNCDNSYVLPTISLTELEGRVVDQYLMQAKMYKDEYTVKYIKGDANIPTFTNFIKAMKDTYKVDEIVRVNAAAYERYKDR